MQAWLAALKPATEVPDYLRAVFDKVGADYQAPTVAELRRVLTVLKVDALASGRNPD